MNFKGFLVNVDFWIDNSVMKHFPDEIRKLTYL